MRKIEELNEKSGAFSAIIFDLCGKLLDEKEYQISGRLWNSCRNMVTYIKEAQTGIRNGEFTDRLSLAGQEARESRHCLRILNKTSEINADYNLYLRNIDEIIDALYREVKPVTKKDFQTITAAHYAD